MNFHYHKSEKKIRDLQIIVKRSFEYHFKFKPYYQKVLLCYNTTITIVTTSSIKSVLLLNTIGISKSFHGSSSGLICLFLGGIQDKTE